MKIFFGHNSYHQQISFLKLLLQKLLLTLLLKILKKRHLIKYRLRFMLGKNQLQKIVFLKKMKKFTPTILKIRINS